MARTKKMRKSKNKRRFRGKRARRAGSGTMISNPAPWNKLLLTINVQIDIESIEPIFTSVKAKDIVDEIKRQLNITTDKRIVFRLFALRMVSFKGLPIALEPNNFAAGNTIGTEEGKYFEELRSIYGYPTTENRNTMVKYNFPSYMRKTIIESNDTPAENMYMFRYGVAPPFDQLDYKGSSIVQFRINLAWRSPDNAPIEKSYFSSRRSFGMVSCPANNNQDDMNDEFDEFDSDDLSILNADGSAAL